jgi:hypothetical protein
MSIENNKRFIFNQVFRDIKDNCEILRSKALSDQQLQYIINAVILPKFDYRAQLTIFSEAECHKLNANI